MLRFKGTMKDAKVGGRPGVRRRMSLKFGLGGALEYIRAGELGVDLTEKPACFRVWELCCGPLLALPELSPQRLRERRT